MRSKSIIACTVGLITIIFPNTFVSAQNSISPRQPQPITIKTNCQNPQTQSEMNLCAGQRAKAAEQQLDTVYRQVLTKFKGNIDLLKPLYDSQLAWNKFRDNTCVFERDRFKGGTIAPLFYANCIERLSQQRTKDLQQYLTE